MKIDRRSFLSFLIGGAAGTALSPLPWKLTDDLSIWTQMWPWTPVPEDGEVTYVNSACTLCPGGCGISVRKVDGRVVKIEGMAGHPVNDGGICILGLTGTQLLYGPSRIRKPIKKINGRWEEVSWEDAIMEIAEKLSVLRSEGNPQALGCICETDRGTVAELFKRFLTVYGSPNFFRVPSIQDSYEAALFLSQGVRAVAGFDVGQSDFVLSFGSGLIEGWGSPVYMFQARAAMRKSGGSINQIEPRLSKTAAKSDLWVPVNPGTEGALALGIAHVILQDGKHHHPFVQEHASGFQAYHRAVRDGYAPETVAQITGVPAERIVFIARQFARARKPLAVCGRGKGLVPESLHTALAVHALNALIGSVNRPGGVVAVPEPAYIDWPDVEMDEIASVGMQRPRIDGAGSDEFPHARYLLNRLPEAINNAPESPLQVLFVSGANPVYTQHGVQDFLAAFEKIPLVVSFSSYFDETSAAADMILPNHVYLERYEDIPAVFGFPRPIVNLVQPAVDPLFDTRYVGDALIQLASEMGGTIAAAFGWENYEACLQETLGDNWDALQEQGYWVDENFTPADWMDGFETASMKFEFQNREIDALPAFQPVEPEGDAGTYPLLLVPYDTIRLAARYVGSPPFLIKSLENTLLKRNVIVAEINPATAREHGLSEGRIATLTTPQGGVRVQIHLVEGLMPGLVAVPRGLGHTAYDRFLAGKGGNVNELIGVVEDPASGLDVAWGIRAKLA